MIYDSIIENIEDCFKGQFINPFLISFVSSITHPNIGRRSYYFYVKVGSCDEHISKYFDTEEEAKEMRSYLLSLIIGNSNLIMCEEEDEDEEEEDEDKNCLIH